MTSTHDNDPPVIHLRSLVAQVHAETIEYAERASDVRSLEDWIAKGDYRQAEFKAGQIIERQRQFREAQQSGLPAQLQQLVDQVHLEVVEYVDRAADVRSLEEWIAKGDHRQAEFKAKQIVERQQNFRGAQLNGLPTRLQQLIDQLNNDPVEYAGRLSDMLSLEEWIAKGDHRQAEFKAVQISERQQQYRETQRSGLPAQLQQLIDQLHAEEIEYAGRAGDVRSLDEWIAKGDHRQADFKARQIIERQQNFRYAQQNGLPAQLQRLVDQVHADVVEYVGFESDIRSLEEWIAKGDHRQAEFKAGQILERQQNSRAGV